MAAASPQYNKPPITEAVIDFRFSREIEEKQMENVARSLQSRFPNMARGTKIGVAVKQDEVDVRHSRTGLKLTSADTVDIVLLREARLTNSRLAPYEGWEALKARTKSVWKKVTKYIAVRDITRIGVRYVNRIDIPLTEVRLEDWITIGFSVPPLRGASIADFLLRVSTKDERYGINIICRSVTSPLINHSSVVLDFDVYADANLPDREDELWVYLDQFRSKKNELFEQSITEKTRSTFA